MRLGKVALVFFLFLLSLVACSKNSLSQAVSTSQSFGLNADHVPAIGEKVYTVKSGGAEGKRIEGTINGIRKNRDNTTYMIIDFKEQPLPGSPVFFEEKVIGMVYRQSATGNLFEALPAGVISNFMNIVGCRADNTMQASVDMRGKTYPGEVSIPEVKGYIEAHDYDRAEEILREALKKDPDNAGLHEWLGIALLESGRAPQAAAEFKKAVTIEPGSADFHNGFGYAMLAEDSFTEAIASFKEAIRINPRHADAHFGLGAAYVNTGYITLAAEEYKILRGIDKNMADSLFQMILKGGGFGP